MALYRLPSGYFCWYVGRYLCPESKNKSRYVGNGCLYTPQLPQLIENYRNDNADAISLLFLFVWFVGDIANLIGGIWAGLVPVIIAIAVYFCVADGVLIAQCLYYRVRNSRREAHHNRRRSSTDSPEPTTPLLGRLPEENSRAAQQDANGRRNDQAENAIAKVVEEGETGRSAWAKNTVSLLAICVVGVAGWTIAWQTGVWKPVSQDGNGGVDMAAGAQVLGYFSAVAYLGYLSPDELAVLGIIWLTRCVQCPVAPDLQELLRQVMRRYVILPRN